MEIMTSQGIARAETDWPGLPGNVRFLLVLTHGAGGEPDSPDLLAVRDEALGLGGVVARVTQPYRIRGARAPGSAARQDAAWVEIVHALRRAAEQGKTGQRSGTGHPGLPLIQGGRSNGARVACRTAQEVAAKAVIALAFPLHPPGRPDRSRVAELRAAGVPVLVVNGDRDPFGIPDRGDADQVVVLAGESHALTRKPGEVGRAVAAWLGKQVPP